MDFTELAKHIWYVGHRYAEAIEHTDFQYCCVAGFGRYDDDPEITHIEFYGEFQCESRVEMEMPIHLVNLSGVYLEDAIREIAERHQAKKDFEKKLKEESIRNHRIERIKELRKEIEKLENLL